jgi:hypothetical protein
VRESVVKRIALIAVFGLAAPWLAAGQDAAPPLEENPRAAHFRDVERGLFVGFSAGYMGLFKTPTQDRAMYPGAGDDGGRAGGMMVGLEIGGDLSSRVSLSVFGQGGNERAKVSYGAFNLYGGGLDLRYSYYGKKDRNDWERFFLYVHARGAYARTYPEGLFGKNEMLVQGGPGVEYFTRLRHFSIGFAVDALYATKAKAAGFAAYPTVRYTF